MSYSVRTGAPPSTCEPLPERWVERIFERLVALYGSGFTERWSEVDPAQMRAMWAHELGGYTADELQAGLAACKERPWAPTLPEFLMLCRPSIEPEAAFAEATLQLVKREHNEDTWSHPAIYYAAVQVGEHDMRSSNFGQLKARWTAALKHQLARGEWPPIPKRPLALPAPPLNREIALQNLQAIRSLLQGARHAQ